MKGVFEHKPKSGIIIRVQRHSHICNMFQADTSVVVPWLPLYATVLLDSHFPMICFSVEEVSWISRLVQSIHK